VDFEQDLVERALVLVIDLSAYSSLIHYCSEITAHFIHRRIISCLSARLNCRDYVLANDRDIKSVFTVAVFVVRLTF
jgi:hypothetical protein